MAMAWVCLSPQTCFPPIFWLVDQRIVFLGYDDDFFVSFHFD